MDIVLGSLALVLGSALFCLAMARTVAANPDTVVPQAWGRPAHFPRVVYLYRLPGILLMLVGFSAWSQVIDLWALLLFLAAFVPSAVINTGHNRRVHRRRTPSPV